MADGSGAEKQKLVQNCFRVHGECGACDWIYLVVASAANEDPWSDLASTIPPMDVTLSDPRLAVRLNETFCPEEDEAANGAQGSKYDPTAQNYFSQHIFLQSRLVGLIR